MELQITNTLSGKKENFVPINGKNVLMYVCGVTPYDYAHIGHGRVYVTFDIFYRLLKFLDYDVKYARNYTDIDDKLLNKAQAELGDKMRYSEVAQKFITAYQSDMAQLKCLTPDVEPRATEVIPQIIEFIEGLIAKDKAYAINGSVYYSVKSFADYGKLSKQKTEELECGSRVEVDPDKKSPLDFALWKNEDENTFWQSPWGWGRPGWHIECSAMSSTFLGKQIDIHAGGLDLIFPHHENEIAQSEGYHGCQFSKYWMHNAFVQINKTKMSKSLGNFFTLKDIFEQVDPMVVRYYFATHSYTAPLDFNLEELKGLQKSYNKLCRALASAPNKKLSNSEIQKSEIIQKVLAFLCDDLNFSGMFGTIFENLSNLDEQEKSCLKQFLQNIIGLDMIEIVEKQVEITPEIQALIDERLVARINKNWEVADKIRDKLTALGVEIKDK